MSFLILVGMGMENKKEMKELWVEKYRPKTVDGYVFRDDAQRNPSKKLD